MRFLILQHKNAPGWLYNAVDKIAKESGHILVKWEKHLIAEKDFDGILMLPEHDLVHQYIANKFHLNDFEVTIGRGFYEGVKLKMPHTYYLPWHQFDEDNKQDDFETCEYSKLPGERVIAAATSLRCIENEDTSDFSDYGVLDMWNKATYFDFPELMKTLSKTVIPSSSVSKGQDDLLLLG